MSRLLTQDDAKAVCAVLRPSIEQFLRQFAKREHLAIRVLDPGWPSDPVALYAEDIGHTKEWEHDYGAIAEGKAELCLREKCDSEAVKLQRPFRYQVGDPPFAGGVYVEGLVVACSGVEGYFDQMIARWIAAACRAVATHRLEQEVLSKDLYAIPPGRKSARGRG